MPRTQHRKIPGGKRVKSGSSAQKRLLHADAEQQRGRKQETEDGDQQTTAGYGLVQRQLKEIWGGSPQTYQNA